MQNERTDDRVQMIWAHAVNELTVSPQSVTAHDRVWMAEQMRELRRTLREIRRDIEESADDVVWMRGGIETVCDRITAVLGDQTDDDLPTAAEVRGILKDYLPVSLAEIVQHAIEAHARTSRVMAEPAASQAAGEAIRHLVESYCHGR